ncbi:MAG: response regulator [Acidobacteriaceae bacterium]
MQRRLLCVDDEENIRATLAIILEKHGFQVTTAASVVEALQKITSQKFDVLLSDLNIGNPGDGLTVVSAMRRTQPEAVTMILTGYPAFETALEAIRQQVDDYIVKPANIPALVNAIETKLATPPRPRPLPPRKRVAMILQEQMERIEDLWIAAVQQDSALSRIVAGREQRLAFIGGVLQEVICAAQAYSGEERIRHTGAIAKHAPRPDAEQYTPRMILTEFCLLRRVIAQVVQENLLAVNLSYLIPDLARVNESLDEQAQAALEALAEPLSANFQ